MSKSEKTTNIPRQRIVYKEQHRVRNRRKNWSNILSQQFLFKVDAFFKRPTVFTNYIHIFKKKKKKKKGWRQKAAAVFKTFIR